MTFALHPKLAADTASVVSLAFCEVRLMDDCRYPWLILVPKLADLTDLHQVPDNHQTQMWQEINKASYALETVCQPYKLNVAALGNQVSQLHIHIIARTQNDPAWPGPVWGVGEAVSYTDAARNDLVSKLRNLF